LHEKVFEIKIELEKTIVDSPIVIQVNACGNICRPIMPSSERKSATHYTG
jgi:hypothetical protein